MNVSEEELRAVVQAAVARHVTAEAGQSISPPRPGIRHPSHQLLQVGSGRDSDGVCIIETTVMCSHCGYCQSFGH
jgi:hypothetical protein